MAIKKTDGGWLVDIQPGGRGGKRYRKTFATKAEALTWENWLKAKVSAEPEWAPTKRDTRRLSELADLWWMHKGQQLKDGKNRLSSLKFAAENLSDPTVDRFTANMFVEYRSKRLESGASANRVNHEHAYLRAMFNELQRAGVWKGTNPVAGIRKLKFDEPELTFLSSEQIRLLLDALQSSRYPDPLLITKVCLATGTRWSEAEKLRRSQIHHGAIHLTGTKNGKNRSIPISEQLEQELNAHTSKASFGDQLFRKSKDAFAAAIAQAGIPLPRGQLTHVLRHTFASHFMMNGGNILVLQKILDHSSLTMTMRYAHLAPDHLKEARALNPLDRLIV